MSHIGNKKYVILACLLLVFTPPVIFAQDFEPQTNTETKTDKNENKASITGELASNDQPEKK